MADTNASWLVMGFNAYARENYVVATCATEAEAQRVLLERQKEPNADHMWIAREPS